MLNSEQCKIGATSDLKKSDLKSYINTETRFKYGRKNKVNAKFETALGTLTKRGEIQKVTGRYQLTPAPPAADTVQQSNPSDNPSGCMLP